MRVDRFIENASELLRREGEMDNTYFVFYTDNGVHLGQHRFMPGKLQPYEEDITFRSLCADLASLVESSNRSSSATTTSLRLWLTWEAPTFRPLWTGAVSSRLRRARQPSGRAPPSSAQG